MNIKKVLISKVPYFIRKKATDILHSHELGSCIEVTRRCNLKCVMCDIWKEQDKEELTLGQLKNLFRQLKDLKCKNINLTGGEPLLRKDISEIVSYAKKLGMHITLFTNGVLLNKEIAWKLRQNNIDGVNLSIDGIGRVHDKIRGVPCTYLKVINALEILKKYNIRTTINPIVMDYNIDQLPSLVGLAKKYGASIDFSLLALYGDTDEEEWIKDGKCLYDIIPKMPMEYKGRIKFIADRFNNFNKLNKCTMPYDRISIKSNGDVVPCFYLPTFGNIRERPLAEIWHSEKAKEMKKLAYQRSFENCKRCLL